MSSSTPTTTTTTTSSSSPPEIRILFVCLGNICRSPMAHGIFEHLTSKLAPTLPSSSSSSSSSSFSSPTPTPRFRLDSAGTGAYHAGSAPDPRTMTTLRAHGIRNFKHSARKITTADFGEFDYVLAMDEENLADLRGVRRRAEGKGAKTAGEGEKLAKLCLFGDFGGKVKGEVIEDPWYGGGEGFEIAYEQCVRFSKGLLREVLGEEVEVDV